MYVRIAIDSHKITKSEFLINREISLWFFLSSTVTLILNHCFMINIAFADDLCLMKNALSLFYESIGFKVLFSASDGESLLHHLSVSTLLPDIVFLEISIPQINGIHATKLISENYPGVRVIAFSAYCHEKHVIDMLNMGAMGYLTKNSEPVEILSAAQAVLNNRIYIPSGVLRDCGIPAHIIGTASTKLLRTQMLNKREYEFLAYCASDLSYKEIARKMKVKYKTIDTYRATVSRKLCIQTRSGLAVYATRHNLNLA